MLLALGIIAAIVAFIGDMYTWYLVAEYVGVGIYVAGSIFLPDTLVGPVTFVLNFYVWYRYGVWWPVVAHIFNLLIWATHSYLRDRRQDASYQQW